MTPEIRKTLTKLIDEYGHALTRIQTEKELLKLLEARAVVECNLDKAAFKTVATAYWRDNASAAREVLEGQLDLFDAVRNAAGSAVLEAVK